MSATSGLRLEVRRVVRASPERLWAAWTTPSQLVAWWGPRGVRCIAAELDARVGGRYCIDHETPDGGSIRIEGEMVVVSPPVELVYTWLVTPGPREPELVTVRFESRDATTTEVIVVHERIAEARARDGHAAGWDGCLDGLESYIVRA